MKDNYTSGRELVVTIAKIVAIVLRAEPERANGVLLSEDASDVAQALGIPNNMTYGDSLPYVEQKYQK